MSTTPTRKVAAGLSVLALTLGSGVLLGLPAAAAPAPAQFHRLATLPAYLNNDDPADPAVAEISTITEDGNTVISTDSAGEQLGFFDITDPANPKPAGKVDLPGEPTSVYATGDYILAVVNTSESYADPSGVLIVLDATTRTELASVDLGGQPDSIDVNPDGTLAVIAIENERDEEVNDGDLPQLPSGGVVTIDLTGDPGSFAANHLDLSALSAAAAGFVEPSDLETEYVKFSPSGKKIAVTFQENNGIAIIDADDFSVKGFTAGATSVSGIDTVEDGDIRLDGSISDTPREPDAIGWVDDEHVATANEGDWKGGTRGWTVFDAATGEVVWDAGNSFDHLAVEYGFYPDSRSDAKGSEPEGLAVATIDGTRYAFVGSERANFVAVYDVTDPADPVFTQLVPSTNGPEGLLAVPDRGLLVVSSEEDDPDVSVRATVQIYSLGDGVADTPTIHSEVVDGSPIPWTALGALSAKPDDPTHLWTAPDKALQPSRIFGVDVTKTPALIDSVLPITNADGTPAELDIEGLHAQADGTFLLAVEGSDGAGNKIVQVNAKGVITNTITLPAEIADKLGAQGLEGVTVLPETGDILVAVQRPLKGEDFARIGLYKVTDKAWHWFGYPLETTSTEGDWIGLSEITMVDDDTIAVIERDKLNGPNAKLKAVYTADLPQEWETEPVLLDKKLAIDVLPTLQAFNGWTQEKLEGLTIGADGNVYAVTDNDGVDDSTGETQFLRLGTAKDIFGTDESPSPTPSASPSTTPSEKPTSTPSVKPAQPVGDDGTGNLADTGAPYGIALAAVAGAALVAGGIVALRRR